MSNRYVKSLRAFHNINQSALAETMGLSPVSYNKKETGKVPFTVEEVKFLSEYFKVPIENFFKDEVFNMQTNNV